MEDPKEIYDSAKIAQTDISKLVYSSRPQIIKKVQLKRSVSYLLSISTSFLYQMNDRGHSTVELEKCIADVGRSIEAYSKGPTALGQDDIVQRSMKIVLEMGIHLGGDNPHPGSSIETGIYGIPCINCNKNVMTGAKYCPHCGNKV